MNYKKIIYSISTFNFMYISEFSFFFVVFLKKKLIIGISPNIGILLSIFCCIDFFKPPIKIVSTFLTMTYVVRALPTLDHPSELYVPEFISFIFKTFLLNLKSLNSRLISKTI